MKRYNAWNIRELQIQGWKYYVITALTPVARLCSTHMTREEADKAAYNIYGATVVNIDERIAHINMMEKVHEKARRKIL